MKELIDKAKVLKYLTPRIKTETPYGEGYNKALEDSAALVALMPTIEPEVRDLIDRDAVLSEINEEVDANQEYPEDKLIRKGLRIARKYIEDAPTVNCWIPVEDALPEIKKDHESDCVLCYCDTGAYAFSTLQENFFGQIGFACEKEDDYYHSIGKVIAWMYLPEPPEKE